MVGQAVVAEAIAGDMIRIPGGSFRMGSNKHYPEEAPAHRVTVDPFWIDATPVTYAQFRAFVQATGYVTWAEIDPDPKDYPGAKPNMLKAEIGRASCRERVKSSGGAAALNKKSTN